ncbi:MAG: type II toxin-antitoxin system VapC family toxin [Nitrospira sp.]|nr:type II toxin-antitoxin system VapC family toxin [Nitrospira sp.]
MKAPVLDSSITVAWVLGDEPSTHADAVLEEVTAIGGIAPALWWVEVRNALVIAERKGLLTQEDTAAAVQALDALGVHFDQAPDSNSLLRLARTHGLTAYDAMYLELSIRQQRPLATLDRRLSLAAQAEGITLTS